MSGNPRALPPPEGGGSQSPSGAPPGPTALDRAHLSHQCLGDASLEAELLSLFRSQSLAIAGEVRAAAGPSPRLAADLAHRLKGSALAVGAGRVARAAGMVEAYGRAVPQGPVEAAKMSQAVAELSATVCEAVAEIERPPR